MNFELDITRDAEVEIVVDQSTGSRLNGRGAGTILIEINTNGKFNMWEISLLMKDSTILDMQEI